jgi:predicted house-cleaning noncanonical NTP pyrophosphatase (MazG superfamily)
MVFQSDLLMIGLVFFLLVGAISLYLYMYVQQVDLKVSLLESILLDMKVSNEIKGFDVPADNHAPYVPFKDDTAVAEESSAAPVEELKPFVDEEDVEELAEIIPVAEPVINYETATLKELQAYAKTKGISVGTMKKSQLIETLKGVEQSGFNGESSAFLETSAPVSNEP